MQAEVAAGGSPGFCGMAVCLAAGRVCSCGTFAFAGCPGGVYRAANRLAGLFRQFFWGIA